MGAAGNRRLRIKAVDAWLIANISQGPCVPHRFRKKLNFSRLAGRLEQLDRIAVGIFQLDLFAAGAYFHLIAKMKPGVLQRLSPGRKIRNLEDHPVPPAGLLSATIRHRPGTRSPGTAENQFETPD